MTYRLGIDLGTTFTAAAYVEDGSPRMLELGNRAVSMPSVLFVGDDGRFLYGDAAERRAAAEPERVIREFKRRFGDVVPIVAGGRTFDPVALQTELLRWVLSASAERLAEQPERVVVTHPANWGPYKMQLMRDMVAAAGIPDAALCPEPVAAAVEYAAKRHVPVSAKVVVYDLGGGTFDTAVLEKTDQGFTILGSPLGVEHLGGTDFDEAVFTETLLRLEVENFDADDPVIGRGLNALRRECIEAKEALSSDISTEISSLLPGSVRTVRFTRGELENLIRPSLEESVSTTVRALRMAGVDASAVHAIVLVGGSSRIPMVTELLQSALNVAVAMDTYPKNDIALGAARFALGLPSPTTGTDAFDQPTRRTPVPGTDSTLRPIAAATLPPPPAASPPTASSPTGPPQTGSLPPATPPPATPRPATPQPAHAPGVSQPATAGLPMPPDPITGQPTTGQPMGAPAAESTVPRAVPPGPVPAWMTTGPSPGGPPPTAPDARSISGDAVPPGRRSTRRRILIAAAIGFVVIALGIGAGVVINRVAQQGSSSAGPLGDDSLASAPVTPPSSASPTGSPSRQPTASPTPKVPDSAAYGLPVGDPLPTSELVVPAAAKTGTATVPWLIDATQATKSRELDVPATGNAHGIGIAPDRRTMTYIERGTERVRAMPAEGGKSVLLFDSPTGCGRIRHASWSPTDLDVFVLECSRTDDGPRFLMVVHKDGTLVRRLDTGWRFSADPTISPDGTRIVFWGSSTVAKGDGGSLLVMPIDGSGAATRLTRSGPGGDADPAWSPDGTQLAFRRPVKPGSTNGNIMIMPAIGGAVRTVMSGPADEQKPAWSPDGSQLVVVSDQAPNGGSDRAMGLWRVNADGGDPTRLLQGYWQLSAPTWSRR